MLTAFRREETTMSSGLDAGWEGGATRAYDPNANAWTGWISFAGVMLMLIGWFHALQGIVGIFKEEYFLVPKRDLLVTVDYTTWGWVHVVFGLLAMAVGFGIMRGQFWARIVGVIFAVVSATVNIGFLNATPIWSTIIIAFDVIVIWALTVHGAEMKRFD
jgi:hypothetical protein